MHISAKPFFHRIIVKKLEDKETTHGGIIIPGVSSERPARGEVVATGPDAISKVGDIILYRNGCGTDIDIEEGLFVSMLENPNDLHVAL